MSQQNRNNRPLAALASFFFLLIGVAERGIARGLNHAIE
jgi:hypothetical protein